MIIGYCYVVGDILHFGHIQHLKNCKAMCDKLIAGVLTNKATMEKKPRPIVTFKERLEVVGELKSVDVVAAQEEYSPERNIRSIEPDILFESTSHKKEDIERMRSIVREYGGKVVVMPYFPIQSSTRIKNRVNRRWSIKNVS